MMLGGFIAELMMDVQECIRTRRSMRKYTDEPVAVDKLQRVLEAVQWAPSWVNFQPWEVIVVDDPATKEALQGCVSTTNPGRKAVMQAPLLLAVCGRPKISGYHKGDATTVHGDWLMFDLGIACQNLCLAAWAEGLGTLHLGLLDHCRAADILSLPAEVQLFELIPIGYPAKQSKAPPRKAIKDFVHHGKFGTSWEESESSDEK